MSEEGVTPTELRRVWDLPTRLFHWSLATCVAVGWYLGEYRGFDTIELHFYFGYAIGGLVAFRILWGFVGAPASRLSALLVSPATLLNYLREIGKPRPSYWAGHAPLGSLSVLALLALLVVQASTGLFIEDDALFAGGPLSGSVDAKTQGTLAQIHFIGSRLILAMVALHLLAIAFYSIWKEEDLIGPMISGWKKVRTDHKAASNEATSTDAAD